MKISKLHDIIRFGRCLTYRKIVNVIKLYVSYRISSWFRKPRHAGRPMSLSIEPTTACNLRCPECPSGLRAFTRKTGSLSRDVFRTILDSASRDLVSLTFYFQGEPFIHPAFLDMVATAKKQRIYTVTSTNGHFLSDSTCQKIIASGLDRLIISIDGTTQDVYESYRVGGNLNTVIDGCENLIKARQSAGVHHPYIIFQFLVVRPNEHQIEDVGRLAKRLGVDEVRFKTAQLYDFEDGHELMPENGRYSRYHLSADGKYALKRPPVDQCWKQWHAAVFTWDGNMLPCCFDKDAAHPYGNIRTSTLEELWSGSSARQFRENIFKGRQQIDICANCSEGCKVWA